MVIAIHICNISDKTFTILDAEIVTDCNKRRLTARCYIFKSGK